MMEKLTNEYSPFFAVMFVKDPETSAEWYQKVLGFEEVFRVTTPDGKLVFAHLRWARHAEIVLRLEMEESNEMQIKGRGIELNFLVEDDSLDRVAKRAKEYGWELEREPYNTPWNTREFSLTDPDGFRLNFVQPIVRNK